MKLSEDYAQRLRATRNITGKHRYADTVLMDARIVNVDAGIIEKADIAIVGSRISRVGQVNDLVGPDTNVIRINGVLCSGFIDAHDHIDDTLLPPSIHARLAVPHGTLGIIEDPHEIANAAGPKAVEHFIHDCENALGKIFIVIPSSVPSVPSLETTHRITAAHARRWIRRRNVIGLAEVMDDEGVISQRNKNVLEMIQVTLKERKIVDGHFSNCDGERLQAYIASGISTDHQCIMPEKVAMIIKRGAWAILNGGRIIFEENGNKHTLFDTVVKEEIDTGHLMLCTDDRHAGFINAFGLMDYNVTQAARALQHLGLSKSKAFINAVRMATRNAAECYRLNTDLGSIAPGKIADILEVSANLTTQDEPFSMAVEKVFIDGKLVAKEGQLLAKTTEYKYPSWITNSLHIKHHITMNDLRIKSKDHPFAKVRISQAWHSTETESRILKLPVSKGSVQANVKEDIVKVVVKERHGINGNIGVGFIKGTGLQTGAIATTVSHDSHNLTSIGVNDQDILLAITELIKMKGGMIVVEDREIQAKLSLPIAGLMTNNLTDAIDGQERIRGAAQKLGLKPPFFREFGTTLGITAYPATGTRERPKWTITDKGLVEYPTCKIISVLVSD